MRALVFFVLLAAGCGGSPGVLPGSDLATPVDGGPHPGDGGGLPFGAVCTMNGDCASNVCFIGGNRTFCSLRCAVATQATDCPKPPTSGTCNMQGYCKP